MDTEKILSKITPKDYHNELEIILEDKDFSEDVKNLLLSCIYKIEAGYQDYEVVKQEVVTKKEYLDEILMIIKEKCHHIEIRKETLESMEQGLNRRYEVDKTEGSIILWHPNEKIVLYAIYQLDDRPIYVDEKYSIIRASLSELLNKGENISRVEVLRDFNGWNWNTDEKEIQNITVNLVYQNLIDLLGISFMSQWIHAKELKDYLSLAKQKIIEQFGEENEKEIFKEIANLALLTCLQTNEKEKQYLLEEKEELQQENKRLENKVELLEEISTKRKEAFTKIKEIDTILNDKNLLTQEFKNRNENLPQYHKMLDLSHLVEILTRQRKKIVMRIEEEQKILEPAYYVETKTKIESDLELLKNIELSIEEKKEQIMRHSISLQKAMMNCFKIRIQKIDEMDKTRKREEFIKAIYKFRYYCYLYLENQQYIGEVNELKDNREEIEKLLIKKAEELKYIPKIVKDEDKNFEVASILFCIRIINLENVVIEVNSSEMTQIMIYETNTLEKQMTVDIPKEQFMIKFDKKIKLLG